MTKVNWSAALSGLVLIGAATAAVAQDIQPQNGTWLVDTDVRSNAGCPQDMVELFSLSGPMPVEFTVPFNPTGLPQGHPSFSRVGPNQWFGKTDLSDTDANGLYQMIVTNAYHVLSETEIALERTMTLNVTGSRGAEIGLNRPTCTAILDIGMERQS